MANRSASVILSEPACGKLNLTLDVLGKRPDGYHDLRMVMCSVALHDDVLIDIAAEEASCSVRAENGIVGVPAGEQNLAWKALRAYADAAALELGSVSVEIIKRIPAQAGMGGGSSDAAAVLRALNRHFGAFSDAALRALGLTLGSDVPYCLFGGTALAEGRGERLTRLPALPEELYAVLVRPDFSVSTPRLFAALDARGGAARADRFPSMQAALEAGDPAAIGRALGNDFAAVLAQEQPVIGTVKRELLAHGALGSELTGTGSVVFGLFRGAQAAEAAAAALRPRYPLVLATKAN